MASERRQTSLSDPPWLAQQIRQALASAGAVAVTADEIFDRVPVPMLCSSTAPGVLTPPTRTSLLCS